MSEEYSNRFESEVMRLLNTLILKVDRNTESISALESETVGLKSETSALRSETSVINDKLERLNNKFDIMAGQLNDIGSKVVANDIRLTNVENEIRNLKDNLH